MTLNPKKASVARAKFNSDLALPYDLRLLDFESAMQDLYDFFHDINSFQVNRGLPRLEDMLRPANLSGTISDFVTESLGKHSKVLTPNLYHNGHPDLVVNGRYPGNAIKSGTDGVEVKTTRKQGGAVDTHGGRDQTMCVFVYDIDNDPAKAAVDREPLTIREIYVAQVLESDFRKNERGALGTRTATLDREGIKRFREGWVYLDYPATVTAGMRRAGPWRTA